MGRLPCPSLSAETAFWSSAHSQAVMASLMLSSASFSSFPCETHLGSAGHSATIQPSSACSSVTWKIMCPVSSTMVPRKPFFGKRSSQHRSLNDFQSFAHAFQDLQRAGQFFLRVGGSDDGANAGFALGDRGEADALGKDASGKKLP